MLRNFFQLRRLRREARHLAHEARHTCRMREDVAPAAVIERIEAGRKAVREAARRGDAAALAAARGPLVEALIEANPPRPAAGFRENLEMIVVAVSVAMAVRCFFIQPFKIPTGSMQPTLYGVTVQLQEEPAWYDRFPLNIPGWALFGEGYVEVRARKTGVVGRDVQRTEDGFLFFIDGEPHAIRRDMPRFFEPGDRITRGTRLASGRVRMGDHVFVNKVRYNFSPPRRGHVTVFDTDRIDYPEIRRNAFYIKRLCGLPRESVGIVPPHIVANGEPVRDPPVFRRIVEDAAAGYAGHVPAPFQRPPRPHLAEPSDRMDLGAHEFLMLGDNTRSSLDGRYFGAVRRESIVGPAFMVYWPISRRWGSIR